MTQPADSTLRRRSVFAGVGAVGALATVAAVLPARSPQLAAGATADGAAPPDGGYRLTDHIRRYYATARV